MSDPTKSSPPSSPPKEHSPLISQPSTPAAVASRDIVRDVFMWKRKKLSILVLLVSTVTYVVLEVYNLNFLPLASYVAIAISASLFASASLLRLMGKEPPDLSGLEITEERAVKMGITLKELSEEALRWMLRVGAEGELFGFAKIVSVLWIISYVAKFTDLLTFVYTGIVVGVSVPPVYTKYEHQIKEIGNRTRVQIARVYNMTNDRIVNKVKNVADGEKMDKKGKKIE